MSFARAAVLTAALLPAAGCSVRPTADLPVGPATFEIVKQIRCESYYALRDDFINLIEKEEKTNRSGTGPRPGTAQRLKDKTLSFDELNASVVGREMALKIERYRKTTIGYSFSFDVTEANNLSAGASFVRPFLKGPVGLNLQGQADRSRQNVRTFRIVDVWEDLLADQKAAVAARAKGLRPESNARTCQPYERLEENILIPIHGKIGMQNQIRLFYDLNETGNLAGATDNAPTLTDTVSFVSLIRGSVNPTIQIGLSGSDFQLVNANLNAEARRQDAHKVIIVITLPEASQPNTTAESRSRTVSELERQEDLQAQTIDRNVLEAIVRGTR